MSLGCHGIEAPGRLCVPFVEEDEGEEERRENRMAKAKSHFGAKDSKPNLTLYSLILTLDG